MNAEASPTLYDRATFVMAPACPALPSMTRRIRSTAEMAKLVRRVIIDIMPKDVVDSIQTIKEVCVLLEASSQPRRPPVVGAKVLNINDGWQLVNLRIFQKEAERCVASTTHPTTIGGTATARVWSAGLRKIEQKADVLLEQELKDR